MVFKDEKEVIVFSAVRSNVDGKLGFVSDWRRVNVMLTRARRGCIIVGNARMLEADCLWSQWFQWAKAKGVVCGEPATGSWCPKYLVEGPGSMDAAQEPSSFDSLGTTVEPSSSYETGSMCAQDEAPACWEELVDR